MKYIAGQGFMSQSVAERLELEFAQHGPIRGSSGVPWFDVVWQRVMRNLVNKKLNLVATAAFVEEANRRAALSAQSSLKVSSDSDVGLN